MKSFMDWLTEVATLEKSSGNGNSTIDDDDYGDDGDNDPWKYANIVKKWCVNNPQIIKQFSEIIQNEMIQSVEPKIRPFTGGQKNGTPPTFPIDGVGIIFIDWIAERQTQTFQNIIADINQLIRRSDLAHELGIDPPLHELNWQDMIVTNIFSQIYVNKDYSDILIAGFQLMKNPDANTVRIMEEYAKKANINHFRYEYRKKFAEQIPNSKFDFSFMKKLNSQSNPSIRDFSFDARHGKGREYNNKNGIMEIIVECYYNYRLYQE